MKKLIVIEANPFYLKGLEHMAADSEISIIKMNENMHLDKVVASIGQMTFDGLLMDISNPFYGFKQFIDFINYFSNFFNYSKKLIIFSHSSEEVVHPFIPLECSYYWIKKSLSIEECTQALKIAFQQNITSQLADNKLTYNERQTLLDLLNGLKPSDISTLRQKSVKTVSAHKLNALKKLNFKNMQQLISALNISEVA